jgi:DNA-binding transcriptional ArsR family regulator
MKLSNSDKVVHQKILDMQCEICKSLGHPLRLQIVDRLAKGESSASDLIAALEIPKASLSKHMALLLRGGIVESKREGRQIFYHLTDPEIHEACAIMLSILYRRLKQEGKLASAIKPAKADP